MSDLSFNVKILADRKIDIRQRKFAGTQGDYKSCTITFDVSEIYNPDTKFQIEWFGCADTYSKTILLEVGDDKTVSAEVPQEILGVGGTATVYLNEVKVENDKVQQIICSYPLRLYLGNKATGNNSVAVGEYNRNVTDMYLAVVNTKQDVANYVKSFEETKQGLDDLVENAEQIKSDIAEDVASAETAKKEAVSASSSAKSYATDSQRHAEGAQRSANSALASANSASSSAVSAKASEDKAKEYRDESSSNLNDMRGKVAEAESYATGNDSARPGSSEDNAKYYSQLAKSYVEGDDEIRPGSSDDNLKTYTEQIQSMLDSGIVKTDYQELTDEQKAQARGNIGAVSSSELSAGLSDKATFEYVNNHLSGKLTRMFFDDLEQARDYIETSSDEVDFEAVIYMIPNGKTDGDNIYNEYMWRDGNFELIGSTAIDLTGYVTKATFDSLHLTDRIVPIGLPVKDTVAKTLTFQNFYLNGIYYRVQNPVVNYSEMGNKISVVVELEDLSEQIGDATLSFYEDYSNDEILDLVENGSTSVYGYYRYIPAGSGYAEDMFSYYFSANPIFTYGLGDFEARLKEKIDGEYAKLTDLELHDLPRNIRIASYDSSSVTVDFETGDATYNTATLDVDLSIDGKVAIYLHKISVDGGYVYTLIPEYAVSNAVAKVYAFTYKVTNGEFHYLAVGNTVVLNKLVLIESVTCDGTAGTYTFSDLNLEYAYLDITSLAGFESNQPYRVYINGNASYVVGYFNGLVHTTNKLEAFVRIDLKNLQALKGMAQDKANIPAQETKVGNDVLQNVSAITSITIAPYNADVLIQNGSTITLKGREVQ